MGKVKYMHMEIIDGGWRIGEAWQRRNDGSWDWFAVSYTHGVFVGPCSCYTEIKQTLIKALNGRESSS